MGSIGYLLAGDWLQLSPTNNVRFFIPPTAASDHYYAYGYQAYMAVDTVVFLTQTNRMKHDQQFFDLTQRRRFGQDLSDHDLKLYESRVLNNNLRIPYLSFNASSQYIPFITSNNKLRQALNTTTMIEFCKYNQIQCYT